MPLARPGCYLCFWLTCHKAEVLKTPSLGSVNLLEQLAGNRMTHLITNLPWKTLNNRNQQWEGERHRARPGIKGLASSWGSGPGTVAGMRVRASQRGSCWQKGRRVVPLRSNEGFTTRAWSINRSINSLAPGDWFSLQPFPLFGVGLNGPNISSSAALATSFILRCVPKATSLT